MHAFRNLANGLATGLLWAAAAFCALPCEAGDRPDDDIEAQYQHDRIMCLTGLTHQDRSACLREAAAARDAARRCRLADECTPSQYLENALKRCQRLPEADRADCEARVRGEGTQRGSVEAGGIYRELRSLQPPHSGD